MPVRQIRPPGNIDHGFSLSRSIQTGHNRRIHPVPLMATSPRPSAAIRLVKSDQSHPICFLAHPPFMFLTSSFPSAFHAHLPSSPPPLDVITPSFDLAHSPAPNHPARPNPPFHRTAWVLPSFHSHTQPSFKPRDTPRLLHNFTRPSPRFKLRPVGSDQESDEDNTRVTRTYDRRPNPPCQVFFFSRANVHVDSHFKRLPSLQPSS